MAKAKNSKAQDEEGPKAESPKEGGDEKDTKLTKPDEDLNSLTLAKDFPPTGVIAGKKDRWKSKK